MPLPLGTRAPVTWQGSPNPAGSSPSGSTQCTWHMKSLWDPHSPVFLKAEQLEELRKALHRPLANIMGLLTELIMSVGDYTDFSTKIKN